MSNYTIYHCHSDLSNPTTTMDSVTKFKMYIDKAKELNMTAFAFSEHGNVYEYLHKKEYIEQNGMKYIHAVEAYVTKTLDEKVRDNYHVILIAKNYEGFKELNYLMSHEVANNRKDGHFYYVPRITYDELKNTSDNIIITTACLASMLNSGDKELEIDYIQFLAKNKHRCFLEIQHHLVKQQISYNKKLLDISNKTGIRLIAGTDTHNLDARYSEGRGILQKAKNTHFENEDGWDLDFKTYKELVLAYKKQNALSEKDYMKAIQNTNILANMIEEFKIDRSHKYPKLYDDIENVLKSKIKEGIKNRNVILDDEKTKRIKHEFNVIKNNGAIDYILLEEDYKSWCRQNNIPYGYSRGCFTKDALVVTNTTLKPINKVQIGDKVITDNGKFNEVVNTFEYGIQEDMIEFEYQAQGSSYKKYKNICTVDHRILINRNNIIKYIPAHEINEKDLLCTPKIQPENKNIKFDLANYNQNDYKYDNDYIYEIFTANKSYMYSPRWFADNGINISHNWAKRFAYTNINITRKKGKENEKLFFENTPFKCRKNYQKYCKKHGFGFNNIPRYIEIDYLWNVFIGLMYGDGWVRKNTTEIGLAINNTTKSKFNKYVFYAIAKRLGLRVTEHNSNNGKNLIQLYMYSKTISDWIKKEFFISKKGKNKIFNSILLKQNKVNLKWLWIGLLKSDGSIKRNKISFDNTSLSIINAFRIINNILGYNPMTLDCRLSHKDKRGYTNKESYKAHRPIKRKKRIIRQNDNYWFLPITKIIRHKNIKTKVYDLQVKDNHSYMINNIIVHNSISGSYIAYLLKITEMDSIKHNLIFERFLNPDRIAGLCDIDTDLSPSKRDLVKDYLYQKEGLYCADIITFNTIALKGAIRDVGRALEIPLSEVDEISKNVDTREDKLREKYPELFKYVDLLNGVVVSVGTHPAGVVVSPYPLEDIVGTCTLSTNDYPVTQLNMVEIDSRNFVKLDLLGLDNIEIIDETCTLANIPTPTPDTIDDNDVNVWNSIKDSTLGVFQWESNTAKIYYRQLFSDETISKIKSQNPDFKYINLFSMGNGAIRPAGESYRDALATGEYKDNGHEVLNEFLKPTLGYLVFQEQILEFLNKFCGFTMGRSDIVRRGFAKKTGTDEYLPSIKEGFIKTMDKKYGVCKIEAEKIIVDFIKVIEDASSYLFSINHSQSYSYIGYVCAWLRYYYPLEFLTSLLNVCKNDFEKTTNAFEYLTKHTNITLNPAKFRYSGGNYTMNKATNSIYKGISSIKNISSQLGEELFTLKDNQYNSFIHLLYDIKNKTSCNTRELDILIQLDFFSEFGKSQKLLDFVPYFNAIYEAKVINKDKFEKLNHIISKYSRETEKQYRDIDNYKILEEIWNSIPNKEISIAEKLKAQIDYLGYIDYANPKIDKKYILVTKLNTRYSPKFIGYCLNNGKTQELKVYKQKIGRGIPGVKSYFKHNPFEDGDLLYTKKFRDSLKSRKTDSGFEKIPNTQEWWLIDYKVVNDDVIDCIIND